MTPEQELILKEIKVAELKRYIDLTTNDKLWLKSHADMTLHGVLGYKRKWERGKYYNDIILSNIEKIIENWHYHQKKVIEIPCVCDENLSLPQILHDTLKELIIELDKKIIYNNNIEKTKPDSYCFAAKDIRNTKYSLDQHYFKGRSRDEIAVEFGYTRAAIDHQIDANCLNPLFNGERIYGNIVINPALKSRMEHAREAYMFNTIEHILPHEYDGCGNDLVKKFMQLDIVDTQNTGVNRRYLANLSSVKLFVPRGEKEFYERIMWCILGELVQHEAPVDKEFILDTVNETLPDIYQGQAYDKSFVDAILQCETLIEQREDGFLLKPQYLRDKSCRIARIIYEAGGEVITTDDIKKEYKLLYQEDINQVFAVQGYNCYATGKGRWMYGGQPQSQPQLQTLIREYAEDQQVFYYEDIRQYINQQGNYPYSERTIRTYITNVAVTDIKDPNHFCHLGFTDLHKNYDWKTPMNYGVTNWVGKQVKEIFDQIATVDNIGIPFDTVVGQVAQRANGTEYEGYLRSVLAMYVRSISGGDNCPFVIEGGYLKKSEMYAETNFEILGLKGTNYRYYDQIRSIAAEVAHKKDNGRILLTDLEKEVNEIITDKKIHRNTIRKAIDSEIYKQDILKIETVDGRLYVVYDITKDEIAPKYVAIKEEQTTQADAAEVRYEKVAMPTQPDYQPYVDRFNWNDLTSELMNDLNIYPYKNWMQYEGNEMAEAIKIFEDFMSKSRNEDIRKNIPHNIFDYYTTATTNDIRKLYMGRLAITYEALLCEIYERQNGEKIRAHGLRDVTKNYYPEIEDILASRDKQRGFAGIAQTLYNIRQRFAHGNPLEISTGEITRNIIQFAALYVYTIAKYYA